MSDGKSIKKQVDQLNESSPNEWHFKMTFYITYLINVRVMYLYIFQGFFTDTGVILKVWAKINQYQSTAKGETSA